MKRLISVFVLALMFFSLFSNPITVLADESQEVGLCSIALENDNFNVLLNVGNSSTSTYGGKTYYTKGKQLYNKIKTQAENRENISFYYYSNQKVSNIENLIQEMIFNSCSDEISTTSTDGDYTMWNIFGYDYEYTSFKSNNKYYYNIDMKMYYNADAAQEKEVSATVNSFVNSVDFSKESDYQIIRRVYDYICNKADYDYDAVYAAGNTSNLYKYRTSFSAYGALIEGSCVCQGYALAFYRICKELGYDVRFVYSDPNEGCHAWNIIMLDGKYYFVDCTWGDDEVTDDYFLVDYDTLRKNDTPFTFFGSSREHTLDSDLTDDDYFVENYYNYLTEDDYDFNELSMSNSIIYTTYSSYSYKGSKITPTVKVKFGKNNLVKNTDYSVSYSDNTNTGIAKINIKGQGVYSGSAKRRFYIMPTQVSDFKSSSVTDSSVTLNWSTPKGSISGYRIYRYKNGSWSSVKKVSSSANSIKISSLSGGSTYRFKIRPYKISGGKTIYGNSSEVLTVATKPKSPRIKSLSTKSKSLTVSWGKVTCSGYQVQYSTSSSMSNSKSYYTTANSKKISSLKKGKHYYVRVRAYKEYKNAQGKTQRVYGSWSSKKSVVVK